MPANERDWWNEPTERLPGHDLPRPRFDPRAPTEPMPPVPPPPPRPPRPPRPADTSRDSGHAGARAWEATCALARYWRVWLFLWFCWVYSQPSTSGAFDLTATVLGVGLAVALIVGIVSWCLLSLRVFSR